MATVVVCLLLAVAAPADDPVYSGPQAGEPLPPLNVTIAYGKRQGAHVDLVAAAAVRPSLFVFVNGANRPAARLSRVLLNYSEMRTEDGLFTALIWLAQDRTAAEQYLRQAISWWGTALPVGISRDGLEGPGSYGLNRNVNVTILIAHKNKVTANHALVQPNETDAQRILKDVIKLIDGELPTKAEVVFLSVPTRKPVKAKWHTAPQDVLFRRLVCTLLASQDGVAARNAARAIEKFVSDNADRQAQLGSIAHTLGEGRTRVVGIPATIHLRRWRAQAQQSR